MPVQHDLFYKPLPEGHIVELGRRYPVQFGSGVYYLEIEGWAGDGQLFGIDRWGNSVLFKRSALLMENEE